ncbi:hypothetical protein [Ensifer sp. 4252]|uniref:hypothetical protein n=1 Tax=Ensifer sp. 4252 TaxID=3373915 RepID=UPI003D19416C
MIFIVGPDDALRIVSGAYSSEKKLKLAFYQRNNQISDVMLDLLFNLDQQIELHTGGERGAQFGKTGAFDRCRTS